MKKFFMTLLFILSPAVLSAQVQDTISLKLYITEGFQIVEIASAKIVEGQEYILSPTTLNPPFNGYQYYYDALVGSKFYIEEWGLDHNVNINILLSVPPTIPWLVDNKRVWFFATFEVEGVIGQDFYFLNDKAAVLEIPRTPAFDAMIQQLGFTPGTHWFFTYYKTGVGFVNIDISTINQPDRVICKLRHFSDVVAGDQSLVSVDENLIAKAPVNFELSQNYPNPFNPSTDIEYYVPEKSHISIKIFDIIGNEIMTLVNETKHKGYYKVKFDASSLPSGVYIYKLESNKVTLSRKMSLIK